MPKPWLRLYTEMLDDPKVGSLSDAEFRAWVSVLMIQGAHGDDEGNTGMTAPEIEWRVRRPVAPEITSLTARGLLKTDARGVVSVPAWQSRQFRSDSSTERVKKHRSKLAPVKQSETFHETPHETKCNALEQSRAEQKQSRAEVLTHPAPDGESERAPLVVPEVAGQSRSETDPDIQHARLHYLQGKPKLFVGTRPHPETREAIRIWREVPGAPKIVDREAERLSHLVLPRDAADNAREIAERVAANEFTRRKMPFAVAFRPKNLQDILAGAYPADTAPETGSGSISEATRLRFIHGGQK